MERKITRKLEKYCAKVSIDTSSFQYENDDLMRDCFNDDYGIACCVSPMTFRKTNAIFRSESHLPKALLYAINGGIDELTKVQVTPENAKKVEGEYLDFDDVWK